MRWLPFRACRHLCATCLRAARSHRDAPKLTMHVNTLPPYKLWRCLLQTMCACVTTRKARHEPVCDHPEQTRPAEGP